MRQLLFTVSVVSLLVALALVALGHGPPGAPGRKMSAAPNVRGVAPPTSVAPPSDPAARPAVRRFLAVFLAYEIGEGGAAARQEIRRTAAAGFARELLAAPIHRASLHRHRGATRVISLHLHALPGGFDLILATGSARRPDGVEPFSFVFVRRDGHWLAVAPGE
jgi:hypothetical protein